MAEGQGVPWERWLSVGGSIVAPATAISTLLFYFGYVSTRAQYLYFGLDVDTIGLSTQGFVMRSPQPILVPLLAVTVVTAVAIIAGRRLRPRLARHASTALAVGLVAVALGFGLLLSYPLLAAWPYYPLLTPLVLAVSGAVAAYALTLRQAALSARVAMWLMVATAVFWANATVAQWSGRGLAQEQASAMEELPRVVLDTRERLYLGGTELTETALPAEEGQTFRYRYRGWRLLVQNGDRMFLVACRQGSPGGPCVWQDGSPTVVIRMGDAVRVQFLPP